MNESKREGPHQVDDGYWERQYQTQADKIRQLQADKQRLEDGLDTAKGIIKTLMGDIDELIDQRDNGGGVWGKLTARALEERDQLRRELDDQVKTNGVLRAEIDVLITQRAKRDERIAKLEAELKAAKNEIERIHQIIDNEIDIDTR